MIRRAFIPARKTRGIKKQAATGWRNVRVIAIFDKVAIISVFRRGKWQKPESVSTDVFGKDRITHPNPSAIPSS